jgi:UDP-2,3-diacylglucosamine hydrolase
MKISAISDVHVKKPFDDASNLLVSFLQHSEVESSDYIILLGDIFDLMCGPHRAYLTDFSYIFDLLENHLLQGKRVLYFEGNHDIHLQKLFTQRWPDGSIRSYQEALIEEIDGKSYYFSHGDEHEVDNLEYQKYKRIITSSPLRFVANYLMPYRVLSFFGERASQLSRKKGSKSYNEQKVRERFRRGVTQVTEGKYDFILGGHSHVQDTYKIGQGGVYINNGYALKSRTFICINDHQVEFVPL